MKTKILTTVGVYLLMTSTSSVFGQVPGTQQLNQTQQNASQQLNQTQQNATQLQQSNTQQLKQDASKAQQTAATKTASSSSFIKSAEQEVGKIATAVNNLSPDQKAKLQQVFVNFFTKKAENKTTAAGNADQLKQLNAGANKSKMDAIKGILTSDQFTTWRKSLQSKIAPASTAPAK